MGFLTERDNDASGGGTDLTGDEPSFAVAGFLSNAGSDGGGGSGDSGGDSDGFDPAIHISRDKRNADGSYTRKRGRKPGGANSSAPRNRSKADTQASVEGLTRILVILHTGIAAATKTPEIAIDEGDANTLAKAAANVLSEFDIRPDPKIEAIIGLITAIGVVHGPMIVNIQMRKKREVTERRQQQGQYQ